ncbi:ATP-binding SpoIIE family protein phosphatase [Candidatus Magnetaquicoccus inordinatus]|uniref:ATP-binding SpoIIE family protein phosphatase n=1 Tax=Candidatus Magnetaquicoccus inordinatus TaxID=2496818 RepID=UPI00102B31B4|nr:SpoIIE family protein phosphatase [Candidatus Magnetaquicoccus inordinatus]
MKILIVDDDRINSTILHRLLSREGHQVFSAEDGLAGVEMFDSERPELVLMDIRMPRMNGYEAAREIKRISSDRFVPIIFLTAVTDEEGLVQCIESGGDDFLTKPFNRTLLQAKIEAMERIRRLHTELHSQKEELERHQERVQQELDISQHLFSNIVRAGNLFDAPCLRHISRPMSQFNGDLLVASYNPAGGLHIMLGDFTGHGLSAAVGAMPLSELFYGMTAQGYSIGDIADEMNAKLLSIMPTRMFCAACLLEVDMRQQSLMVWNGGLPDILLVDGQGRMQQRIASYHLPLGIRPFNPDDRKVSIFELRPDTRIFLYSDGLTEATRHDNLMYGSERLERHFDGNRQPEHLFDDIISDLDSFRAGAQQSDDITLLEINCARANEEPVSDSLAHARKKFIPPTNWSLSFFFSPQLLQTVDPLPAIINSVMNLQAPAGHRERIYTTLAELFSNALDHGLLGLDTKTKQTPEGFMRYYSQREERLAALEHGFIRLELTHIPQYDEKQQKTGGEMHIRVEDGGPGFDHQHVHSTLDGNMGHGGRGIALVRSLCTKLAYNEAGNCADVVYRWTI